MIIKVDKFSVEYKDGCNLFSVASVRPNLSMEKPDGKTIFLADYKTEKDLHIAVITFKGAMVRKEKEVDLSPNKIERLRMLSERNNG